MTVMEICLDARFSISYKKGKINIPVNKIARFESLIGGRVNFKASEIKGAGGFLHRAVKKPVMLISFFVLLTLLILSQRLIWDIRIDGVDDKDGVLKDLEKCSFFVGGLWSKVDKSKVEAEFLSVSDDAAWININQRGAVAYVTLIPKVINEPDPVPVGYSNIVAKQDGIIEEITVKRGSQAVEKGMTVKKGDLLISGMIINETGASFLSAEGQVTARVYDELTVFAPRIVKEKKFESKELCNLKIKIFNFSVNIFKRYGNPSNECDIMKGKKDLTLFGRKIPISFLYTHRIPYVYSERLLDDGELIKNGAVLLEERLSQRLENASLHSISTERELSADGYTVKARIICVEEIGRTLSFDAQKE